MSNKTKIFNEAIAEAKAIRETAMANAKLALEEAFAPRIQEMMSDKLEALSEEDEMEEGYHQEETKNEEISLEELLSELEDLEEGTEEMEEGTEEMEEGKHKEMEEGKEEMEETTIAEVEADDEVGSISVDELKDIIRDILADVMGGEEEMGEEEMGEEEVEGVEEMSAEDNLELEEILAEISSLDEMGGSTMREPSDSAAAGLDAIISGLKKLIVKGGPIAAKAKAALADLGSAAGSAIRNESEAKELQEAMSTITILRSELNEVNLLNAKLLYVNKLFKAKNLNEAQKVKVINAFDRAETVREAKNVFDTLNESLNTEKVKSQIKESLSFASKAAGVADRQPIMEGNDFVNRMQKLAGII